MSLVAYDSDEAEPSLDDPREGHDGHEQRVQVEEVIGEEQEAGMKRGFIPQVHLLPPPTTPIDASLQVVFLNLFFVKIDMLGKSETIFGVENAWNALSRQTRRVTIFS